ncbi:exocyst complex component EXO70A1 isoform X1 [Aegilops tauschii subsp. strangulata]|uniref:Exocyst subunit Exo70 family protein n=1 Tax=Aegilops tauschii subsp. strangulata TaxID=200361 RepID=A0A453DAZ5_AEGTS|nr:exocyst complex component EXO70A1 [Aegilops tauschii subsp. strangulata]XP_020154716.1 exocyst complex component EXO70A1 [Aegilops tauschii subsp. strangulata]
MEKVHMYLIDPEASILLKEIAELMILVGHAPNICRDYGETRHHMLMQFLSLLSVQIEQKSYNNPAATTTNGACSMQLYEKNQKMWIQALKVFVSTVLPEERNSCAQIFGCDRKVEEDCFARATTRCTGQLLAVGSMMTNVKVYDQQHHKVPLLLQMHEELIKLQRSINVLLSGDAKGVISEQASMLLDKLGEEASSLLMEFLNVCSNPKPCQNIVLDGDILPLTRHVMGFVEQLTECSDTVNLILLPILEEEEEGAEITKSPWECYVRILLARLQLKFEENAESYKDERLRYIFLMNNAMHVLKGLGSSDLSMSMGNDNHQQLVVRVEQYGTAYLRASWTGALSHLSDHAVSDYDVLFRPGFLCHWMRKGIKNFNSAFGEITRVQTTWKVPDPQLRQHLRLIILQQVLTAYRTYLERYGCYLGNNESEYVKYTPDEIENDVLDLFEG